MDNKDIKVLFGYSNDNNLVNNCSNFGLTSEKPMIVDFYGIMDDNYGNSYLIVRNEDKKFIVREALYDVYSGKKKKGILYVNQMVSPITSEFEEHFNTISNKIKNKKEFINIFQKYINGISFYIEKTAKKYGCFNAIEMDSSRFLKLKEELRTTKGHRR